MTIRRIKIPMRFHGFLRSRFMDDIFVLPTPAPAIVDVPLRKLSRRRRRTFSLPKLGELAAPATAALILPMIVANLAFAQMRTTISYFADEEGNSANNLEAGSLDFSLAADPLVLDVPLETETVSSSVTLTPNPDSFPIAYKVTAQETGESVAGLCEIVGTNITATEFAYSGPLLALTTAPPATTIGTDVFEFFLPANAGDTYANGDTCNVDLVYKGFRAGGVEGQGYQDEERISLLLRALIPNTLNQSSADTSSFSALSAEEPLPEGVVDGEIPPETPPTDTPADHRPDRESVRDERLDERLDERQNREARDTNDQTDEQTLENTNTDTPSEPTPETLVETPPAEIPPSETPPADVPPSPADVPPAPPADTPPPAPEAPPAPTE